MVRLFQLSIIVAVFFLCGPQFVSKSTFQLQNGISWASLNDPNPLGSHNLFEPDNFESEKDESPTEISFQLPDFTVSGLLNTCQTYLGGSFLSDYGGRLQFLNIPPPQSLV